MVKIQSSDSIRNIYKHGTQKDALTNLSNVDIIFDDKHEDNDADRAIGVHSAATPHDSNEILRKEIVDKTIHYYCPNCNATYVEHFTEHVTCTTDKISYATTTWRVCDECDNCAVEVDEQMLDIIVKLNKIGLKTEYCCEGHGFEDPAYISFDSSAESLFADIVAPYLWEFESNNMVSDIAKYGHTTASTFVDNWDDLFDRKTWERCDGTISILYKGMKVAVNDSNLVRCGIFVCTDCDNIAWEKIPFSENMQYKTDLVPNRCLRPILSSEPHRLQQIYGLHFDIYKNLYMNALRCWVDNVQTILMDRFNQGEE